jgi:hypothetical protein
MRIEISANKTPSRPVSTKMKPFLFFLGLVAAGILGYSFEPNLRLSLTGKAPGKGKPSSIAPAVAQSPALANIDAATFPADQLPEKVMLKGDAEIADPASDLKMKIAAGSRVNLIRLDGDHVIISPGAGPLEGRVPISQTDLLEQLAALPKNPAPVQPELVVTPPPVPEVPVEPAAPEPAPAPDPAPAPEPAPVPAAEPAPAPAPATPDGPVDVVAVMQGSIKGGEIKEFTFDQVLDWQAGDGTETVDGETYHTGIASYKAETVFGVKTIQAKALIKGGKVVRWLWPKSGMEIK